MVQAEAASPAWLSCLHLLVLEPLPVRCVNIHEVICVLCWIWGS